jgi:hypothetical protein
MIKIDGFEIKPTIFPDGTSQVWKIPDELFNKSGLTIDWRFEREDEEKEGLLETVFIDGAIVRPTNFDLIRILANI